MTFRQIIEALWQRSWVIAAVAILAAFAAAAYLQQQTPSFAAQATLRMSPQAVAGTLATDFGSADVDLDPAAISSSKVLDAAAAALHLPKGSLTGAVTWSMDQTQQSQQQPSLLSITATAHSPAAAQKEANATATAYLAYLKKQVDDGVAQLNAQYSTASGELAAAQKVSQRNPDDATAAANTARASQKVNTLGTAIDAISLAGQPARMQAQAGPGERQGASPMLVIASAFAGGIIAGMGIALVWAQLDTRVRYARELEELTEAPLISQLPWDRKIVRQGGPLAVLSRKRTPLNEGFRTLRTSLQVLARNSVPTIVVTSVEPNDGKTFVSANLAAAWARTGKEVVLIGGDLRCPELSTYFGEAGDGKGLSELLAAPGEAATVDESLVLGQLRATEVDGLRVLPSGAEPAEPADLLAHERLGAVIDVLRAHAEVIIIDSPPAHGLIDAALLSHHATGAIVLTALRRTRRERIVDTVESLLANDANVLGIVANRSRAKLSSSYSRYYRTPPAVTATAEAKLRTQPHPHPRSVEQHG
ncbi:hypothetical protein GCM10022286_18120 [Gryllotalpicola daejeonensis]|uniref:Non-specific protein-tyrosine kinase n=1 Tax=Gryllotalpicola daejeonensis TaxID=993087 RepID=A0ABP7ZK37_9MICO